jgi:hypothetical protein
VIVLVRFVNVVFALYGIGLVAFALVPAPKVAKFEAIWQAAGRIFKPLLDFLRHFVEPIRLGGRVLDLAPLFGLVFVAIAWAILHYILTGSITSSA